MTNEEPKITFESILQNWNAQYNPITKAQTRQPVKALGLSATMRNPQTPAGTYPAFETYLGVDVLEKKRQLKQEKRRKRKEIRGKIFGFLKVVIPILLVGGAIIGGFMFFFKPSTPQNTSGDIKNVPQVVETIATASPTTTTSAAPTPTAVPEGTVIPTAGATPDQKHCLTTPPNLPSWTATVHCITVKALDVIHTMCPLMKTVVYDTRRRTEVVTIQTMGIQ